MRESNAEHQASVNVHPSIADSGRPGTLPVDAVGGSSSLRRALLIRLRHDGPSSPEDLATGLGVSRTGVLQQLHALETAGLVHGWYHKHHVLGQEAPLMTARLALARAAQIVLRNGLGILGISAPDRM